MPVSQLGHEQDWVQTSILSQRVGDELEGLAVGLADVRVVAEDGSRVLLKLMGDFHFHACATWDQGSLFDKGSDNAEGIMEGAVCLVEHELVRASEQDGDGLALVGALSDLDDFSAAASADFFNETGRAELLGLELVNVGHGCGTKSLADEINIIAVDVLDDHDLLLGEEMEGQVTDGFSKNALLEEKHVGA